MNNIKYWILSRLSSLCCRAGSRAINWGDWIAHKAGVVAEPPPPPLSEGEVLRMLEDVWNKTPERCRFTKRYEADFGNVDIHYTPFGSVPKKPKKARRKSGL